MELGIGDCGDRMEEGVGAVVVWRGMEGGLWWSTEEGSVEAVVVVWRALGGGDEGFDLI